MLRFLLYPPQSCRDLKLQTYQSNQRSHVPKEGAITPAHQNQSISARHLSPRTADFVVSGTESTSFIARENEHTFPQLQQDDSSSSLMTENDHTISGGNAIIGGLDSQGRESARQCFERTLSTGVVTISGVSSRRPRDKPQPGDYGRSTAAFLKPIQYMKFAQDSPQVPTTTACSIPCTERYLVDGRCDISFRKRHGMAQPSYTIVSFTSQPRTSLLHVR